MDTAIVINTVQLGFLSFPAELRNKAYRLVLCHPTTIGTDSSDRRRWPDHPLKLSAQLLRTCSQIHTEGLSILYGENTFEIEIYNTWGPYYGRISYSDALSDVFSSTSRNLGNARQTVLPHLRRFSIQVRYTRDHKLGPIRDEARSLVTRLQKLPSPSIEFLRLECRLDCGNEDDEINWYDACWDNYYAEGDKRECIGVLQTWLGRLRNVKEVVVEGMPERDADILQKMWQTQSEEEPLDDDVDSGTLPPLTDMYEALEKHAHDIGFCEKDLRQALLAVERGDLNEFKVRKTAIFHSVRRRWEAMNNEEVLREAEDEA